MALITHLLQQQGSNVLLAVVPQSSAQSGQSLPALPSPRKRSATRQQHGRHSDHTQAEVADFSRLHALGTAARVLRLTRSTQVPTERARSCRLAHCMKPHTDWNLEHFRRLGATLQSGNWILELEGCCRIRVSAAPSATGNHYTAAVEQLEHFQHSQARQAACAVIDCGYLRAICSHGANAEQMSKS
jgi:hypothetical protein